MYISKFTGINGLVNSSFYALQETLNEVWPMEVLPTNMIYAIGKESTELGDPRQIFTAIYDT